MLHASFTSACAVVATTLLLPCRYGPAVTCPCSLCGRSLLRLTGSIRLCRSLPLPLKLRRPGQITCLLPLQRPRHIWGLTLPRYMLPPVSWRISWRAKPSLQFLTPAARRCRRYRHCNSHWLPFLKWLRLLQVLLSRQHHPCLKLTLRPRLFPWLPFPQCRSSPLLQLPTCCGRMVPVHALCALLLLSRVSRMHVLAAPCLSAAGPCHGPPFVRSLSAPPLTAWSLPGQILWGAAASYRVCSGWDIKPSSWRGSRLLLPAAPLTPLTLTPWWPPGALCPQVDPLSCWRIPLGHT